MIEFQGNPFYRLEQIKGAARDLVQINPISNDILILDFACAKHPFFFMARQLDENRKVTGSIDRMCLPRTPYCKQIDQFLDGLSRQKKEVDSLEISQRLAGFLFLEGRLTKNALEEAKVKDRVITVKIEFSGRPLEVKIKEESSLGCVLKLPSRAPQARARAFNDSLEYQVNKRRESF